MKNLSPRFHLLTAVVVSVTWAVFLLLNVLPGAPRIWPGMWSNVATYAKYVPEANADPPRYGFPFAVYPSYTWLDREFKGSGYFSTSEWAWRFIVLDFLLFILILIVVAVVCEVRLRKSNAQLVARSEATSRKAG